MIQRRAVPLVVMLVVVLLGLAACGASSRTKALRGSLVALNTARDSVLALSKEREKQLYDACLIEAQRSPPTCTKEAGHARVLVWQKEVDVAIEAIDIGYRAIHDAALLDDAKSAALAAVAAKKALDIYRQLEQQSKKEKETP